MKTRHWLIAIFTLGAVMRIWGLWYPLWYDENFTLLLARLPLDRMIEATRWDVHPPLFYLTVWPIIQLGAPAWAIRIPSLIMSMAAAWIFWGILVKLGVRRIPALVALGIMMISPWQLYYAQEGRMYAELQFLVLLAFDAAYDRNWLRFGLASALMFYCQNYGPLYALAIGLFVIVRDAQEFWRAWHGNISHRWMWLPWDDSWEMTRKGIFAASAFFPWLWYATIPQMGYLHGTGYWIGEASSGSPGLILLRFFWGMTIPDKFFIPGTYMVTFITACSLIWILTMRPRGWWPILLMLFTPILLAALISWISTPILLHRPLIAVTPFLYAMVGISLTPLCDQPRRVQLFAAIFLVPCLLISSAGYLVNEQRVRGGDEMGDVDNYIRERWQPGDVIYAVGDGPVVDIMATAPDLQLYRFPECQPVISYMSAGTRRALGIVELPIDQVHAQRYWLMFGVTPFSPTCERDFLMQITHGAAKDLIGGQNDLTYGGLYLITTSSEQHLETK